MTTKITEGPLSALKARCQSVREVLSAHPTNNFSPSAMRDMLTDMDVLLGALASKDRQLEAQSQQHADLHRQLNDVHAAKAALARTLAALVVALEAAQAQLKQEEV